MKRELKSIMRYQVHILELKNSVYKVKFQWIFDSRFDTMRISEIDLRLI